MDVISTVRRLRMAVAAFVGTMLFAGALPAQDAVSTVRWYDEDKTLVPHGGKLFATHCGACHGDRAQGAPNWRERDAEGRFPAPPLDGTGHGWHHPAAALLHVIMNGTPGGAGNMPAWRDTLSNRDGAALIAWFQSLWPDEIYRAWLDIEQRSRK